jgi:uncharacterized protein DUF2071
MKLEMVGRLETCVLLEYRTPAASVVALVPRGLELETRGGFAFWNVMACRIRGMRPAGAPSWLGLDYRHVAYRLYVRASLASGGVRRGLFFVRSDIDRRVLAALGNRVSDFRMHAAAIALRTGDAIALDVRSRDAAATLRAEPAPRCDLAPGSPFRDAAEAAKFLEYAPVGLSVDAAGETLRLAEVLRDDALWREDPLAVREARFAFLERLGQRDLAVERASRVAAIDYRWRLGARLALDTKKGGPPRSGPPVSLTSDHGMLKFVMNQVTCGAPISVAPPIPFALPQSSNWRPSTTPA